MSIFLRRFFRITVCIIISIPIIFIIGCFAFDRLIQFRTSDESLLKYFAQEQIKGEVRYYTSGGRKIRYVAMGNDSLPALLFIHGSPSSLSIYKNFFDDPEFRQKFKIYAVDRPGYGYSGLGEPEFSIEKQAEDIYPIVAKYERNKKPLIVIGSSYGTSVSCRLLMDHPKLASGLVLLAPALAPGQEKVFWFTKAIEHPALNWFIPRIFKSANREKVHHKEELSKMLPLWKNITVPVMYMQGSKDELVYTSNAVFAKTMLTNVPSLDIRFFPGRPHFIPFTEHETIRKKILEMADIVAERQAHLSR